MSTVYSQRVLSVPELLSLIFSFLEPKSNTKNAQVSKSWSDIALSALWSHVHDLWTLVHLLAPLKERRGRSYELCHPLQSSDWLRFARYAPLVRKLHYNIHSPTHKHLHHSVFNEIARTRLHLNVLPNLRSLHWITETMRDLGMGIMFMHERVRKLVVWIPFDNPDESELDGGEETEVHSVPYFMEVATRMPRLTHLDLRMDIPARLIMKPLTTLLSSLPALKILILVGISALKDESAVTLFLSHLCPFGIEMECGVTWHADLEEWAGELQDDEDNGNSNLTITTNTLNPTNPAINTIITTTTTTNPNLNPCLSEAKAAADLTTEISTRCKKWEEGGRTLPLLTRLRMEERERGRALEGEVEDHGKRPLLTDGIRNLDCVHPKTDRELSGHGMSVALRNI